MIRVPFFVPKNKFKMYIKIKKQDDFKKINEIKIWNTPYFFNKRCKRSKCSVNTELLINMLKNKKQQKKRKYIKNSRFN